MSATQLLLSPTQPAPAKAGGQPKTCRFAANCSCVFNRVAPPTAPDAARVAGSRAAGSPAARARVVASTPAAVSTSAGVAGPTPGRAPDAVTDGARTAEPGVVDLEAARHNPALDAEVAGLLQRGFTITAASPRQIVLQRRRSIPFCVDVALVAATLGLWGIHVAWRARHPKVETVTLTLNPGFAAA